MDESDRGGLVVVAGEALVDLVPSGDVLRPHPGGGPFNVARAVARLGAPAAFLGRLSEDRFGAVLRGALEEDGVALDWAVGTEDPTTLALAEVGDDGGAAYRFYVEGTSAPGLVRAVLPSDTTMLVVGTLGLVFEPSAGTLERLVAGAPEDVLVAVDPNVRPAAIADVAGYRARLGRVLARADLVKASAEDLAWLVPEAATPVEALRALLGEGAAGVVTLGAGGAVVVPAGGGEPFAVPAPAVDVADTIGAGDAFLGGLLAHWHHHRRRRADLADPAALREAVAFAVRVAAATCERPGADPPTAAQM